MAHICNDIIIMFARVATIIPEFLNQSLRLKIQKFYVLPTECICVFFIHLRKKTANVSLYSINLFVLITKMKRVYCAVRTETSNIRQASLHL